MMEPDYVAGNRAAWTARAAEYAGTASDAWRGEPRWGIWQLPETELRLLPSVCEGIDALELGCGTGYVSAWLHQRGARTWGLDPTSAQLATARSLQERFDHHFPLVLGIAEALPFPDECFDFAISEYGAALWSDPYRWVPECARVLRPGGRLVFLTNAPWLMVCMPSLEADGAPDERMLRPYLGLYESRWADAPGEVEFHLPHGEWVELLVSHGLQVERLLELGAPPGATSRFPWADPGWAVRWPTEEVWVVCKTAGST